MRRACAADVTESDMSWRHFEKLEKGECTDNAVSVRYTGKELQLLTGSELKNCVSNVGRPVWLVFELYGISVKASSGDAPAYNSVQITSDSSVPVRHPDVVGQNIPIGPEPPRTKLNDNAVSLQKAIQRNIVYLKENLRVDEVIDHLFQAEVITPQEYSALQDVEKSRATTRVLMDILSKRLISKRLFIDILEKTCQSFLIPIFFPENEKE